MKNLSTRLSIRRKQPPNASSGEKRLLVHTESLPTYGISNEQNIQNELGNSGGSLASPLSPSSQNSTSLNVDSEQTDGQSTVIFPQQSPTSPKSIRRNITTKIPNRPKAADSIVIDFSREPFQFYTKEIASTWNDSFIQSIFILCVCLLVPSLILAVVIFFSQRGSSKRMKIQDRKKEQLTTMILIIMTIIKDAIVVTTLLHVLYGSPASSYELAYSPIVFIWCLISFLFPLTLFYFANVNYVFGFVSDRTTLLRLVSQLSTSKAKEDEMKKVNNQEKYFQDNYEVLSSIKSTYDEIMFLTSVTPRSLWVTAVVVASVVCLTHSLIPLVFYDCYTCIHYTHLINITHVANQTAHANVYRAVVGMTAVNSLAVSLIAASYFIYIILWNVANIGEWKRFNCTEKDATKTLINNGPQGIAMWWRIFQTLKFFSSSSTCVSVLISKLACVVSVIFIVCQSVGLMYPISTREKLTNSTATLFLIDNVLLYIGLIIIGILSLVISREEAFAKDLILLKKLNIGYELSSMLNIEPEFVDKEQGVPVRLRALRGCLMLLQELSSTMESVQDTTLAHWVLICCILATLFVFPSTFIGIRYIIIM